jgi:hypothetical protein
MQCLHGKALGISIHNLTCVEEGIQGSGVVDVVVVVVTFSLSFFTLPTAASSNSFLIFPTNSFSLTMKDAAHKTITNNNLFLVTDLSPMVQVLQYHQHTLAMAGGYI